MPERESSSKGLGEREGGGGGAQLWSLIERREAEKMHLIFAASPNPLSTQCVWHEAWPVCMRVCGCVWLST